MTIDVRPVSSPEDHAAFREVVNWTYRNSAPEGPDDGPDPGETRFLGRVDGRPATACQVFDYTVARGPADLPCGAVAAVATLAPYRRSGVGGKLMREVVRWMCSRGTALSALYPYRETYYRKFGYASCGWRWEVTCPTARIPEVRSELPVRQVSPDEVSVFSEVYDPFVRRRSGGFLRGAADWTDRLGIKAPTLYAIGDPMEAYAMATLKEFWGTVQVGECAWSTPRGHLALFDLFARLASNQAQVKWHEPPDSPTLAHHSDQGIDAELDRPSMFRVVDLVAALKALRPETEGAFSFAVRDEVLPGNDGPWQVSFRDGEVSVEPGGPPDFTLDVRPLSQAVLGSPGLLELAGQGLVEVARPAGLLAAAQLWTPVPVVCMDFF